MKQGGRKRERLPRCVAETSSACQISQLVCFPSTRRPSEGICWCRYCKYCRVLLEMRADADNTPWHSLSLSPRRGAALIGLCAEGNQHNFLPVLKYRCIGCRGEQSRLFDLLAVLCTKPHWYANEWLSACLHACHKSLKWILDWASRLSWMDGARQCADLFCFRCVIVNVLLFWTGSRTRELFPKQLHHSNTQQWYNPPNVSIWNGRGTIPAQPPVKTLSFSFCTVA